MIDTMEAELAWCPPTLIPSALGRMLLAWWIIQCESHSRRCSMVLRCSGCVLMRVSSLGSLSRRARQGALQIVQDVGHVFKADGEADQPVADAVFGALFGRVGGMR